MRYLIPMLLYIGLTAFVIADIAQHRDEEPYRLPKVIWILIVLFAPYVGAVGWLIARWVNNTGQSQRDYRASSPDDDPAFKVWAVEQERRRRQQGGRD